jgi:uncharacterized BrkB/YihY/UPF0761 family membrane protein
MYAGVIAFEALIALVALVLLGLAVLDEIGRTDVWDQQIAPQIAPKVLPAVYAGIDATVQKIFHSSSGGLIALAAALTIWEMSGVVRVCMAALSRIYGDEDDRPWKVRFSLSLGIGAVLTLALVAAVLLVTAAKNAVHGTWGIPFAILRWLVTIGLIAAAFGILVASHRRRRVQQGGRAEARRSSWSRGSRSRCSSRSTYARSPTTSRSERRGTSSPSPYW